MINNLYVKAPLSEHPFSYLRLIRTREGLNRDEIDFQARLIPGPPLKQRLAKVTPVLPMFGEFFFLTTSKKVTSSLFKGSGGVLYRQVMFL